MPPSRAAIVLSSTRSIAAPGGVADRRGRVDGDRPRDPRDPQRRVVRGVEEEAGPADRARDDVADVCGGGTTRWAGRHRPIGPATASASRATGTDRHRGGAEDGDRGARESDQGGQQERQARCHRGHPTPVLLRARAPRRLPPVTTDDDAGCPDATARPRGRSTSADRSRASNAPPGSASTDTDRPRGLPRRRDAVPPRRPAAGRRLPDDDRPRRRARQDRRRAARADRPARRRHRLSGGAAGIEGG